MSSETKFIILEQLLKISKQFPALLSPFYKKFFIFTLEKIYCKRKKLEILPKIINKVNAKFIFKELDY